MRSISPSHKLLSPWHYNAQLREILTVSLTWTEVHILLFKHRLGCLTDKSHWKADNLVNTNNYLPHYKMLCTFCCVETSMITYIIWNSRNKTQLCFSRLFSGFFTGYRCHKIIIISSNRNNNCLDILIQQWSKKNSPTCFIN